MLSDGSGLPAIARSDGGRDARKPPWVPGEEIRPRHAERRELIVLAAEFLHHVVGTHERRWHPAVTSGLSRFGNTGAFFVGELLGVVFLLAGFLASIEVFAEIRIPFTSLVFRARREPDAR